MSHFCFNASDIFINVPKPERVVLQENLIDFSRSFIKTMMGCDFESVGYPDVFWTCDDEGHELYLNVCVDVNSNYDKHRLSIAFDMLENHLSLFGHECFMLDKVRSYVER